MLKQEIIKRTSEIIAGEIVRATDINVFKRADCETLDTIIQETIDVVETEVNKLILGEVEKVQDNIPVDKWW